MKRVITYGTFDVLHYGHINLLKRAKALGDYLIVGLSTDDFNEMKNKKAYPYSVRDEYARGSTLIGADAPAHKGQSALSSLTRKGRRAISRARLVGRTSSAIPPGWLSADGLPSLKGAFSGYSFPVNAFLQQYMR